MKLISLFSGCGGLDLGLKNAGFTALYANDNDKWCAGTYEKEFPETTFFAGDVREFVEFLRNEKAKHPGKFENIDLVAGGPPCPPFSKSRFYRTEMPRGLNDPTAEITIGSYFDTIELVNPKAFLLENVPGMAYKAHKESLDFILKRGEDLGYQLNWEILNAADYGVPQIRTRFILVGLKNTKFQFPSPTHFDPKTIKTLQNSLTPWVSAGSVLSDLDTEKNADDGGHYAGGKHNNLLKEIPPGDNYLFFTEKRGHKDPKFKWRSRYWSFLLKLSPDLPSWTIQARRSNNMGPFHWRNRILRIQEVKRLQTFPDNWDLEGNIERQWRQLGNAVPPVLAEKIGYSIYNQINLENNG